MEEKCFNPIQDATFRSCSRTGGAKRSKKCINTRHTPWILLTSAFFTKNQQIFVYQEIQIYIAFWCAIFNSFNFFWVLKDFFNKHGYNFDDVSKNGYSKPSWNKVILKWMLWRHNLCLWCHYQVLSRDSNYFVDVVMLPKFVNSSTSMKEVIITSIL